MDTVSDTGQDDFDPRQGDSGPGKVDSEPEHQDSEPLPEGFLEELETLAALKRPCELVFTAENGARAVIRDYIAALYIEEGRGWLKTGGGMEIVLEKLVHVDGMIPSKYC